MIMEDLNILYILTNQNDHFDLITIDKVDMSTPDEGISESGLMNLCL